MKTIHQSNCDVFQFILVCTNCDDERATSAQQMRVYQPVEHGGLVYNFKDVEVNVKYQMKLTPTAKKEVDKLLTHLLQTAGKQPINVTGPPLTGGVNSESKAMNSQ